MFELESFNIWRFQVWIGKSENNSSDRETPDDIGRVDRSELHQLLIQLSFYNKTSYF